MKLPWFIIFAVFMLLLTAVSCGTRRGQLKGEVFIVAKGGENIKLGLVEVTVVSETEINAAIEKKKGAIDSKLAELRSEYDKALAEYNSIHQAYDRAKNNYDKSSQREMDAMLSGNYGVLSDNYARAEKAKEYWSNEQMRLLRSDLEADSKQSQAKWKLEHFPTAEFFSEHLPPAFGKAITNSNGEFTFDLPMKGKFALAARASRQQPDEKYYWLVWVSLDGQASKTVLLSNTTS